MPRRKILSDAEVLQATRQLFAAGGEKAISFGNLSRATGLAASTLAQRFGSVEGLQAAATADGWHGLTEALTAADHLSQGKGPHALLKALEAGDLPIMLLLTLGWRNHEALAQAARWRAHVEMALALRIGQGEKARQQAQMLFAAWQGKLIWQMEEPRLKDLSKRLA
ncbi:transcriptional regulator [Xinfangfangia sp. D13-10-4-6]|uniref:TetR/AcrR family transcriptional regulator n=1 Tax=Pseudogemmobacter hezensis TaxID=2737662 RepID=UPI0015550245|nr:transcriptional regulator [Pseudogemmobacter hezensis]NPD14549.1 transcriptional regulator [Pseudogemmobacter hezensis]